MRVSQTDERLFQINEAWGRGYLLGVFRTGPDVTRHWPPGPFGDQWARAILQVAMEDLYAAEEARVRLG